MLQRIWLLVAALVLATQLGGPDRAVLAQTPRAEPLKPPATATDEMLSGRWEVFAGGRDLPGELISPDAVAMNASGTVYLADPQNSRVQMFTMDGTPAGSFPIWPGWVGRISFVQDLAVAPNGDVLLLFRDPMVLDGSEPYYGIRYAANGTPLGQFGPLGAAPHGLEQPTALDGTADGLVWVTDPRRHRLVAFGRDGHWLREIGGEGTEPGRMRSPVGVGIAPNGTLYVAESGNIRVQVLTQAGVPLAVWDTVGGEWGQFTGPRRVRVARDGSVFVSETDGSGSPPPGVKEHNRRVQRLSPDGTPLAAAWIYRTESLAATPDGGALIMEGASYRGIRRFNRNLEEYDPLVGVTVPDETPGRLGSPDNIATDGHGNVYIVDRTQVAILKYGPDGTLLTRWGTRGYELGQLRNPSGVVVASDGTIYVCDVDLDRVYKLSPDWQLLDVWGGARGAAPVASQRRTASR